MGNLDFRERSTTTILKRGWVTRAFWLLTRRYHHLLFSHIPMFAYSRNYPHLWTKHLEPCRSALHGLSLAKIFKVWLHGISNS